MFEWLKSDPVEQLNKQYQAKIKQAMEIQRDGNIRRYAELTREAELIRESMEVLIAESKNS